MLLVFCKVSVKHFGLHLLGKRPEVFMIPRTFQKSNSFLKYFFQNGRNVAVPDSEVFLL